MKISKNFINISIIILLCFTAYINTLWNGFVWDDTDFIVNRPQIRDLGSTLNSIGSDQYGIYRPLRTIFYHFSYRLYGLNPALYHLQAIILHSIATILLYLILKRLFKSDLIFLATLIFAVHPIHIGRVTNATGSFDLFGIIFLLISLHQYILYRQKNKNLHLIISIASFILGLFSTEEIFTLPLLIVAYEYFFKAKSLRKYKKSIYYFSILALFLFLRIFILKIGSRVTEYPGGSSLTTFLTMPYVILQYLGLTILPIGLTPFRHITFINSINIYFIISMIIGTIIISLLYSYRRDKIIMFFSAWTIITLLPFLNILPLEKIMAERYFYLPSIGFIAILTYMLLNNIRRHRWNKKTVFTGVILILTILTIYNNTFWHDELSLNKRGLKLNPQSSKAYNNIGTYYFQNQDFDLAKDNFEKAVEKDAKNYEAHINLAVIYSKYGEYEKSILEFQNALDIEPNSWEAYEKLGVTYLRMGMNKTAEQMLNNAIKLNPDYYPAYARLATLYGNQGDYTKALAYLQKTLEINPYYAEAYYNMGVIYELTGKTSEAKKYYITAYGLEPDNPVYAVKARS